MTAFLTFRALIQWDTIHDVKPTTNLILHGIWSLSNFLILFVLVQTFRSANVFHSNVTQKHRLCFLFSSDSPNHLTETFNIFLTYFFEILKDNTIIETWFFSCKKQEFLLTNFTYQFIFPIPQKMIFWLIFSFEPTVYDNWKAFAF